MLTTVGLFIGICTSFGQDGQFPGSEEQQPLPVSTTPEERVDDGLQIWDNGAITSESAVQQQSQVSTTSSELSTPSNANGGDKYVEKKGGDDSVLSFNFLYYLIQKFKLSENVE